MGVARLASILFCLLRTALSLPRIADSLNSTTPEDSFPWRPPAQFRIAEIGDPAYEIGLGEATYNLLGWDVSTWGALPEDMTWAFDYRLTPEAQEKYPYSSHIITWVSYLMKMKMMSEWTDASHVWHVPKLGYALYEGSTALGKCLISFPAGLSTLPILTVTNSTTEQRQQQQNSSVTFNGTALPSNLTGEVEEGEVDGPSNFTIGAVSLSEVASSTDSSTTTTTEQKRLVPRRVISFFLFQIFDVFGLISSFEEIQKRYKRGQAYVGSSYEGWRLYVTFLHTSFVVGSRRKAIQWRDVGRAAQVAARSVDERDYFDGFHNKVYQQGEAWLSIDVLPDTDPDMTNVGGQSLPTAS